MTHNLRPHKYWKSQRNQNQAEGRPDFLGNSIPNSTSPLVVWRPLTLRVILLSPILYGMVIPLVFLDLCLTLYHWTAFPFLKIPLVKRASYIQLDRHRLAFLPPILKLTCAYCGYANGLLQYAVRLAGETEAYFCPMKHQGKRDFYPPLHHRYFAEYGDPQGFQQRYFQNPDTPD